MVINIDLNSLRENLLNCQSSGSVKRLFELSCKLSTRFSTIFLLNASENEFLFMLMKGVRSSITKLGSS